MTRSMPRVFVVLSVVLSVTAISAAPASHVPKENTRAAIAAYVQDAAKLVQKGGPSCAAFATPQWRAGDYYIFVADPKGNTLCHPRADLVGTPLSAVVNSKGEKVGEKLNQMAMGSGKGWVDYLWPRPGKNDEELKSTYVLGVIGPDHKHYLVGAGGWGVK